MNFQMAELLGHKPSNCDCSMCQALAEDGEKPLPKQPNYEEAVAERNLHLATLARQKGWEERVEFQDE